MTLFRENFYEMQGAAIAEACARAEQLTQSFLEQMQKRAPNGFDAASEPSMQRALVTAQTEYACSGSQDLGELLVDMLTERAVTEHGSLKSIVLAEAISVASRLPQSHIDALTILFSMRFVTQNSWTSPDLFYSGIDRQLKPFIGGGIPRDLLSYRHMEYVGVGSVSLAEWQPYEHMAKVYPAAFTKGFEETDIPPALAPFRDSGLIVSAVRNPDRLQLAIPNRFFLTHNPNYDVLAPVEAEIISLMSFDLMSGDEVRAEMEERTPVVASVFEAIANSSLKAFEPTSVGFAIAHANWRRHDPDLPDIADLFPSMR